MAAGAFFETSKPPASRSSRGLQPCEATQPTFKVGHFRKPMRHGVAGSSIYKPLQVFSSEYMYRHITPLIGARTPGTHTHLDIRPFIEI